MSVTDSQNKSDSRRSLSFGVIISVLATSAITSIFGSHAPGEKKSGLRNGGEPNYLRRERMFRGDHDRHIAEERSHRRVKQTYAGMLILTVFGTVAIGWSGLRQEQESDKARSINSQPPTPSQMQSGPTLT